MKSPYQHLASKTHPKWFPVVPKKDRWRLEVYTKKIRGEWGVWFFDNMRLSFTLYLTRRVTLPHKVATQLSEYRISLPSWTIHFHALLFVFYFAGLKYDEHGEKCKRDLSSFTVKQDKHFIFQQY